MTEKTTQRPTGLSRVLTWVGAIAGTLLVISVGIEAAGYLATDTKSHDTNTYAAAKTIELNATGDVSVTADPDATEIQVESQSQYVWFAPTYSAVEDPERVEVNFQCQVWTPGGCSTSLDVIVPPDTNVTVRSDDGRVTASGLTGSLEIHNSDGSIVASEISGEVTVHTSDGRIDVNDVIGAVLAASDNGEVKVTNAEGNVEARSSDGRVEVSNVTGAVLASSENGEVEVTDADGDVKATSSDGSVTVAHVKGSATASSSEGNVNVSDISSDVYSHSSDGSVTVLGSGTPVALDIFTAEGTERVDAPTDPDASIHVTVTSDNGDVSYLGPDA